MDKNSIAKEWFDFAKQDLSSAEYLSQKSPPPLENICFHCQQATEKILKGYLIHQEEKTPPRTHDLKLLCKMCAKKDESFEEISQACIDLTPYGVRARYPFEIEIQKNDMEEALGDAKRVMDFTLQKIREKGREVSNVLNTDTYLAFGDNLTQGRKNKYKVIWEKTDKEQRTLDEFSAISKKNAFTHSEKLNAWEHNWDTR
ncbi:MAG TPA: HEPN domain-containing protein [Clostridia bacterium]|jgi:HEPN domain-containing protein|nr:HEPN domain-containing protein [Clostridia bacterium]HHY05477.1 HEPN domain-containing protein [Clostridia bacterium]